MAIKQSLHVLQVKGMLKICRHAKLVLKIISSQISSSFLGVSFLTVDLQLGSSTSFFHKGHKKGIIGITLYCIPAFFTA